MDNPAATPDKLTNSQKITIGVTIGIFLLGTVANILVREWYSPDLRYTIGDNYYLDDRVAFSCEVKNLGHATAKNIRVYAAAEKPFVGHQFTGDVSSKTISGGDGQNRLDLEIDRLVPGAHFTIFYALKQAQSTPVVEKIESDEGLAQTGEPLLWWTLGVLVPNIIGIVFFAMLGRWARRKRREAWEARRANFPDIGNELKRTE
jgi:hypothetical protein